MVQPLRPDSPAKNRLSRFRELMARVDAAADPADALKREEYVLPPGVDATRIAGRLELRPTSTHLLIGGVGSGKTTELLETRRRLAELPDVKPIYVDVSKDHDISQMAPGVVAVQVGLAMAPFVRALVRAADPAETKRVDGLVRQLDLLAHGRSYDPREDEYDQEPGWAFRKGVLVPPVEVALQGHLAEAIELLKLLLEDVRNVGARVVVLIDGLDRLTDVTAFELVVDYDVKALASIGLGVVLVGPLKCLYRSSRIITQSFDYFAKQPWHDPNTDEVAHEFLCDVMRRRLNADALDEEGLGTLVLRSGGVLRDLVAIAQLACEEAYIAGADIVDRHAVDSAVDAFGRKHMLGLQRDEIDVLQRVRMSGSFVQTSDNELSLLLTRRVLEYVTDSRPRYVVHPTIEPLLRELAGELG